MALTFGMGSVSTASTSSDVLGDCRVDFSSCVKNLWDGSRARSGFSWNSECVARTALAICFLGNRSLNLRFRISRTKFEHSGLLLSIGTLSPKPYTLKEP